MVPRAASYGWGMARVGGRNLAASWITGILCAGVIGALVWFALPAGAVFAEMVTDALRVFAG